MATLPPGFTIDKPAPAAGGALPPGFTLDSAATPVPAAPEQSHFAKWFHDNIIGFDRVQPGGNLKAASFGLLSDQNVDDLKHPMRAFQAADDLARTSADFLSLGYLDKALGGDERAKTEAARQRAGSAATALDAALGVASGSAAAGLVPEGAGLGKAALRTLGYAGEGAGQSALAAAGHDKSAGEIGKDAAIGAGLGTVGSLLGGLFGRSKARSDAREAQVFKTDADVKAASKAKYDIVDKSGSAYPIKATDSLISDLDNLLVNEKVTPGLDDRVIATINRFKKDWQGKPIDATELDRTRRWVDKKLIKADPRSDDARLGYLIKDQIDKLTKSNQLIDPITGQIDTTTNKALGEARDLHSTFAQSKQVSKAITTAQSKANRSGSGLTGGNIENTTRQEFAKLQAKVDEGRGNFSPEAKARIDQLAEGTTLRNIGRFGSAISPLRGGIPAIGWKSLLGVTTGGASTALGMGGEILNQIGQRATRQEAEDLAALIRNGQDLKGDPATIAAARQRLSQLLVSIYRGGDGPAPQGTQ